jgi:hypothetical protein
MHDLVIRGATVIDGLGHDPRRAYVAVEGDRIAAIGEVGKEADPATVGVSPPRWLTDLPASGARTLRDPIDVHGIFVNGIGVFDGREYPRLGKGPGQVVDRFLPAREVGLASAAQ